MLSFMLFADPVYCLEATRTSQIWPLREITFFCRGNFHCWASTYHYNIFQFFELIEICKKLSESKFGVFASMRATATKRLAFRVRRLLCALLSRSVVRRFDARNVCGYAALACTLAQVIILLFVASLVFPMAAAASLLEICNENQHTKKCDFF